MKHPRPSHHASFSVANGLNDHQGRCARLRPLRRTRQPRAFVLLEIVLAIGLFSIVAVSMTRALDQVARTSRAARSEGQVLRVLESVLAEVSHQPKLKPGGIRFEAGADGVEADATIEPIKLYTRNKQLLDHMFLIRVKAWIPDGRSRLFAREMKTYVYSPNSPER